MKAKIILLFTATTIIYLFMVIDNDEVTKLRSPFMCFVSQKCYNKTLPAFLPFNATKNLNDTVAETKINDTCKTNGTTRSNNTSLLGNICKNKSSQTSAKSDIPKTLDLKMTSVRPGAPKTLYLQFFGRLGNMLFQIAGLFGLKRTTNSSQMYFTENQVVHKLIKLFPNIKPLLKTVPNLPTGLLHLNERKGGYFDPSLAQKIRASKSDVRISTYLSKFGFVFQ